jgi:DnaK suppressor protein
VAAKKPVKKAAKPAAKPAKSAKPAKPAHKAIASKSAAKRPAAKPAPKASAKQAVKPSAKAGTKAVGKAKPAPAKSSPLKKVASALVKALKPSAKSGAKTLTKPAAKATPTTKPDKATVRKAAPVAKPLAAKPAPAKPQSPPTTTKAKGAPPAVAKVPQAPVATSAKVSSEGPRTKVEKSVVSKSSSSPVEAIRSRPTGPKGVAAPPGTIKLAPVKGKVMPKYQSDSAGRPIVPQGYRPSADEEYMNPLHMEYFRNRLLQWREDLVEESKQTIENLKEEVRDVGDEAERATRETENSLELRTRDRYRKLIGKIDDALKRVDDGSYGWCLDTGEEIGLERLEARLTAERTIDAQERWEHRQRQMGD